MIRFCCENCGQKVLALKIQSGKTCRCPNCGKNILVPKHEEKIDKRYSEHDLSFLNIREKEEVRRLQIDEMEAFKEAEQKEQNTQETQETEKARRRRFPWQIDIFLYPISRPGLIHLAVFIGVPLLMKILLMISPVQLLLLIGFFSKVISIILFLYLYWYLAECIRDSAAGWVRAPEGIGGLPDFSDLVMQTTNIIGCLAFFLLPAVIYAIAVKSINVIAWLLIISAIFFYPMGLLSVVLYDSVAGLSRRILFGSVRKTFRPYAGLFLLYCAILFVVIVYMASQAGLPAKMTFRFFVIYFALVLAHLTGRFYWKYKEKLKWKV